ncbi:MAG TPA: hypothetical protein VKA46_18720 [Gemmataceae bacterium]|nr:hypothetical protein [Gemmataceae bacterium]
MAQTNEEYRDKDVQVQRAPAITILAAEALRGAANAPRPVDPSAGRGEERISLFWRVFGGTLLSIAALVVVTLYQQFSSSLNDLRGDVVRLNEARSDLVKKDEFNSRMSTMWNGLNDAKAAGAGLAGVRDKQTLHDQQLKQNEDDRKDLLREVQLLRERVAKLEGREERPKPHGGASSDIPD